ncbi:MAG: hypothetical protein ACREON_13925 [Gemmatimonadaceae bacterium]
MRFPRQARAARVLGAAVGAITIVLTAACSDDDDAPLAPVGPEATVITASGDIAAKVTEFRALLGEPSNGGTAGQQGSGRREIGWDGGAANPFNNRNDFPADFFNTVAKNGAVFTTPGTGFRNDSLKFAEIDASYAAEFNTFSPTKIFSPVGSNVTDVLFRVAGSPTPAAVTGFGIVFTDVDVARSAKIELFDEDGRSLGVYDAPVRSDAAGLSFVGAHFDEAIVARVRITTGTGALGAGVKDVSAGGALDLVVMDNLIYGEPQALSN